MLSDKPAGIVASLATDLSNLSLHENAAVLDVFCRKFKSQTLDKLEKKEGALTTLEGVLTVCDNAICAFEQSKLSQFDPLASDCSCQNRAAFVSLQAMRFLSDTHFQEKCASFKARVAEKLDTLRVEKGTYEALKKQKGAKTISQKFEDLMKVFDVEAPKEVIALCECFMLTKAKQIDRISTRCFGCLEKGVPTFKEKTDRRKIDELRGVSRTSQDTLIEDAKVRLSEFCCKFLQKQAQTLDAQLSSMLSGTNLKVLQGKYELPCFYTIKAALESSLALKVSLLVKVKKSQHLVENIDDPFDVAILFRKNDSGLLEPFFPTTADAIQPCFVVEGTRCGKSIERETPFEYTKRLLNFDIQKLFELNAAQHGQYTKQKDIDEDPSLCEEREKLKGLKMQAKIMGCSLKNQSLFCITHIFCDTIANQMRCITPFEPGVES